MTPRKAKAGPPEAVSRLKDVPPAPDDLEAAGRRIWEICWLLSRMSVEDEPSIARLARLEDEAARLRRAVAAAGEWLERPVQNSRGQQLGTETHGHPGIDSLRRLGREAAVLCDSLGLSPGARSKLGIEIPVEPKPPDRLDELREAVRKRRQEGSEAAARAQAEASNGHGARR
jgi:hypothetical protein